MRLLGSIWVLLKTTYYEWSADKAPRLAAALAYYTTLSLAPLLMVVISVAGLLFGREAVQGELVGQIAAVTGRDSAKAIEELLANASAPAASVLASILGIATLVIGAIGVAWQLKDALNEIWDVAPNPAAGWMDTTRAAFASFALVLGVGFVLLVSLVVSAVLAALNSYFTRLIPGSEAVWLAVNSIVSLGVVTLLFAMIFKYVPDRQVSWSDVWIGAAATAVFFEIGKLLVGVYLGRAGIASAYGAAGSFVIVLVWIYYAAQILLFGAEFTQVYARHQSAKAVEAQPPQPQAPPPRGVPAGGGFAHPPGPRSG